METWGKTRKICANEHCSKDMRHTVREQKLTGGGDWGEGMDTRGALRQDKCPTQRTNNPYWYLKKGGNGEHSKKKRDKRRDKKGYPGRELAERRTSKES